MDKNVIRLRKSTDVGELCNEIVELISSGKVVGIEAMGQASNFLALQAMIEAKELLMTLG